MTPRSCGLALALVGSLAALADAEPASGGQGRDEIAISTEGKLVGTTGGISSEHPAATRAGLEMLQRGGNVVDAAVATALTMCVVWHGNMGLGGYGEMVFHRRDMKEPVIVSFNTRAPLAATAEMFQADPGASGAGIRAMGTWSAVAGLAVALEKYGTMKWADVVQPAIRHAEEGFVIGQKFDFLLKIAYRELQKWPGSKAIFSRPEGGPLRPGDRLVQRDLARSLRALAQEGPDAIYTGPLARTLVDYIRTQGGIMAMEDLASWRERLVRIRKPAHTSYRGYDLYTSPVTTGGQLSLAVLNLLKGFDLRAAGWSAEAVHLMLESYKLAFADRRALQADPWIVKVPTVGMMSEAYASERRRLIDPDVAWPYAKAGDPWKYDTAGPEVFETTATGTTGRAIGTAFRPPQVSLRTIPPSSPEANTSAIAAVDKDGNLVALTMTLGAMLGSGVTVPGTGITLNNGMGLFHTSASEAQPIADHPNRIQGGKTGLNSLSPFIALKDGKPFLAIAAAGGSRIMTETVAALVRVIDWDMDVHEAVGAPRFHVEQRQPSLLEAAFPFGMARELEAKGHALQAGGTGGTTPRWGAIFAVLVDPNTGAYHVSREWRTDAANAGVLGPQK